MPTGDGKAAGSRRGSHRGPARGPQLLKAGGLLLAVALLLAGVGAGIIWTTDSSATDPGEYRAEKVKDLCDAVATKPLKKFASKEADRSSDTDTGQTPAKFTCELRFKSDKDSPAYQAITLNLDARVEDTVADAEKSFSSAVEYEKSRGYTVNNAKKAGDEAAVVPKANTDPQECRAHIRSSNAVMSAEMTVSGARLSCDDKGVALLLKTGTSTLDVMRSE